MPPNALLMFDLDGTLVDSRADLTTGINLMRAEHDLGPLSVATVVGYVGNGVHLLVERALADSDRAYDLEAAVASMRRHYTAHLLDQTTLYPGAEDALEALESRGYALAVVTNKPESEARQILSCLGILSRFGVVVGGGTCGSIKPDPESLFYALSRCSCEPAGSWMIGDNYTDLEAGRRARVCCCFCRFGFGSQRDEAYDMAVDSLTECAALLP